MPIVWVQQGKADVLKGVENRLGLLNVPWITESEVNEYQVLISSEDGNAQDKKGEQDDIFSM